MKYDLVGYCKTDEYILCRIAVLDQQQETIKTIVQPDGDGAGIYAIDTKQQIEIEKFIGFDQLNKNADWFLEPRVEYSARIIETEGKSNTEIAKDILGKNYIEPED